MVANAVEGSEGRARRDTIRAMDPTVTIRLAALALTTALLASGCVDPPDAPSVDASVARDGAPLLDAGALDAGALDAARRLDTGPDAGPPSDLDEAVAYWARVGSLAGVAALAADDERRIVVTTGMASATREVDEHTLFNVASLSKTFTGALALSLVEAGLLDLDAPLSELVPDVVIAHPRFPEVPITTRMLLTHTSGLVDDFIALGRATSVGAEDPAEGLEPFVRGYVGDPAHWGPAPGTARAYCNACFAVIGLVVERASGEAFSSVFHEALAPIDLDGASFFFADVDRDRLAALYAKSGRGYSEVPHSGYAFYPATSMMISLVGVERWLRLHEDDGVYGGVRVLSASSVEETRRIQFPDVDRSQALVWYTQSLGGRRFFGHSGAGFGASAQMRYRPEERRLLIVLSNSDAYVRSRLGLEEGADAIDAILDALDRALDAP